MSPGLQHTCDVGFGPASAFGWQWQPHQLLEASPQPTRTVLVLTPGGGFTEQQIMQISGGSQTVRAINALDPYGACTAVSFHDVRSATAFRDRVSKVQSDPGWSSFP